MLVFCLSTNFYAESKANSGNKRQAVVKCALTVETEKEILFDSITGKKSTSSEHQNTKANHILHFSRRLFFRLLPLALVVLLALQCTLPFVLKS